jgi:outer membrane protein assembly factor BamB
MTGPGKKKSIRNKALLTFICTCMLLATQVCTVPGQDSAEVREPAAEDWPQWRGPSSNGVSSETDLPTEWSLDSNIVWKAELAGLGGSSPIVWGDRVFVTSQMGSAAVREGSHPQLARDDPSLVVEEHPMGGQRSEPRPDSSEVFLIIEAFNRTNGNRLWEYRILATGPFPELHEKHNLATPTPVTDGEHLYAWFGNGLIVCLDMQGRPVWSRHLGQEYAPFQIQWGHAILLLICSHSTSGPEKNYGKRTAVRAGNPTALRCSCQVLKATN